MVDKPSTKRQELEKIKPLLSGAGVIRGACDLDLLVFLHRHPRTLLTNEQLAAFVGYDMKQVARSVDAFSDAGLLERTQNPKHAARMYVLLLNGPLGDGLKAILRLACTRGGRRDILNILDRGQSQPAADVAPKERRLHAIA